MKADRELRKRLVSILAGFIFCILAIIAIFVSCDPKNEAGYSEIYLMVYLLIAPFFGGRIIIDDKHDFDYFNLVWFYVGYAPLFVLIYCIIMAFIKSIIMPFIKSIKNYIDD